jgi:deoxyribonuclease V
MGSGLGHLVDSKPVGRHSGWYSTGMLRQNDRVIGQLMPWSASTRDDETYAEQNFTPRVTVPWPAATGEAVAVQKRIARQVSEMAMGRSPSLVAGADVHLRRDSNIGIAVSAVVSLSDLELFELVCAETPVTFSYVPGLLSFRKLPPLINAFHRLSRRPDVLLIDGHGRSHPRRFGLACHVGFELDISAVGCAKSRLTGVFQEPGADPGQSTTLAIDGEAMATALRARRGSRPLFISIGHRVDLPGGADGRQFHPGRTPAAGTASHSPQSCPRTPSSEEETAAIGPVPPPMGSYAAPSRHILSL